MTLSVYGHLFPEHLDTVAAKLDMPRRQAVADRAKR